MARLIVLAIVALGVAFAVSVAIRRTEAALRVLSKDKGAVMPRAPEIAYVLLIVLLFMATTGAL